MKVKRRSVKVKELRERCIIKAFKLSNQAWYERVSPEVTSSQDGKGYKMAKRDYDSLMILRRWQKKMHFLLTTLNVFYVLTTLMPKLLEDATVEAIIISENWENDDYICRGHILNGMSDSLFDVYMNVESAKELWDSLESKYMAEDSSSKKFLDFKHTLKHGKDDLSLVQLDSHLPIEESLRAQDNDKGKGKEVARPSMNMTEEGKNKNNKQNKRKKRDFKEHGSAVAHLFRLAEYGEVRPALAILSIDDLLQEKNACDN
nr:zinc finger, CCHC-type [Tanacetum cinerariifolium]